MTRTGDTTNTPAGGLCAGTRMVSRWRWQTRGGLRSQPVRCRTDTWYLARATPANGQVAPGTELMVAFSGDGQPVKNRRVRLQAVYPAGVSGELFAWFESPPNATRFSLYLPEAAKMPLARLELQDVSERDPKCHPSANVPRWSTYQPLLKPRRLVLPSSLYELARLIDWIELQIVDRPKSTRHFRRLTRGAACIVDPAWVRGLKMTLADIEQAAGAAWLLVSLDTLAELVRSAALADAKVRTHRCPHGLMSARVEYAGVATRGFALQDVIPFSWSDVAGHWGLQELRVNRSWKRYADQVGFATLLSSETPWAAKHGDILSAQRAVGGGELLATDLPWLVAGRYGPLVAPRLAAHLLRMHLAAPIEDHLQYWTRWDAGNVVIRDLADLARRYAGLQAVRWTDAPPGMARLGISLVPPAQPASRHTIIETGRIDAAGIHDGLPPEPMAIFMKWLARLVREGDKWARQHLPDQIVTWQFDTADGLKYAANFDQLAVAALPPGRAIRVRLRLDDQPPPPRGTMVLPADEGLLGDGSLAFQDNLTRRLRTCLASM